MTDQIGTPGSTADTSVNGSKIGSIKDKQCPFCNQNFTSSSLGRHLDLYIKEKNPKTADGIHDVDEIRKLRGGITRRQPRNSTSKREDSTPAGTPGAQDRRSAPPESEGRGNRSPSIRRDTLENGRYPGHPKVYLNKGSWENTGVMNNIPVARNGDSVRSWDGEERDSSRRLEGRNRSVSKQMLAKNTFEQKQKMMDALDNAKAAELALREMLGSFRAAKQRIEGPTVFDYDPLTLDFPALTLHCLPPPPTLQQSTPLATSTSWSILPPSDQQYEALRSHFSAEFHRWRISCAIATQTPHDDLSYPPLSHTQHLYHEDPVEVATRAEAQAAELESKISEHLHTMFAHWNSFTPSKRSEIWTLNLARSVGRKSDEIQSLKKSRDLAQQEAEHLKLQVEELSRLQHPREFKIAPPSTIPVDSRLMAAVGDIGLNSGSSVGFNLADRNQHIDVVVEQAIGRWKGVVKEARGGGGLGIQGQRSLSGESSSSSRQQLQAQSQNNSGGGGLKPRVHTPQLSVQNMDRNQGQERERERNQGNMMSHTPTPTHTNHTIMDLTNGTSNGNTDMGSDADADADADMEDESFLESIDEPQHGVQGANYRLANGNGGGSGGMEGLENQNCVQGYVRIGA